MSDCQAQLLTTIPVKRKVGEYVLRRFGKLRYLPLLSNITTDLFVRISQTAIDNYSGYLSHPQKQVTQEFWLPPQRSLDQLDLMLPTGPPLELR